MYLLSLCAGQLALPGNGCLGNVGRLNDLPAIASETIARLEV